jgi:dTDP-4-amino-4,6-dideoxygalactose transaminase
VSDSSIAPALRMPQADPARRLRRHEQALMAAMQEVLRGGHYILGPAVARFEAAFARYLEVPHCIGVNSGTDALALALRAAGLPQGGEVIVPALTAAGTAAAVVQAGGVPVLADVNPYTRNLDVDASRAAITPRTAAILAVHLHGIPADILALKALATQNGLLLIEDCAQAHGARVGTRKVGSFGDAAAFSFYPTKNLGALGDGGAVVTGDPALAARVTALRNHGWRDAQRVSSEAGGNSRLDELQAAILLVLLPFLDADNAARVGVANTYRAALKASAVGLPPDVPGAVYHQFAITLEARDDVQTRLARLGIGTAVHYPLPLHAQPAFSASQRGALPVSERLAETLLSLPIQPEVAMGRVPEISARLYEALAGA